MSKVLPAAMSLGIIATLMLFGGQAKSGGILGRLLFGSLDDTQAECQAQSPNNFSGTWRCIRAHVARGHTGDMQNGAALKYMATGDMLFAKVRDHQMDDATALMLFRSPTWNTALRILRLLRLGFARFHVNHMPAGLLLIASKQRVHPFLVPRRETAESEEEIEMTPW